MIGHVFQILDGTMEKDFDVAFFSTFGEENDQSDGRGDDFETVSTKYESCWLLPFKLHQAASIQSKMHENRWRLGLRPRPHWGAYSAPPDPLAAMD